MENSENIQENCNLLNKILYKIKFHRYRIVKNSIRLTLARSILTAMLLFMPACEARNDKEVVDDSVNYEQNIDKKDVENECSLNSKQGKEEYIFTENDLNNQYKLVSEYTLQL